MATYYDALGVPTDAPREEIERALERTQARLRQMGQWEQQRDLFRNIEATLMDGDARRQYDMQVAAKGLLGPSATGPMPAAKAAAKPAPKAAAAPPARKPGGTAAAAGGVRKGLLWAAAGVLVAGLAYGGWVLVGLLGAKADVGATLVDSASGQVVGVILDKDPAHLFPGNSRPSPAVLIYFTGPKRAVWLGESVLGVNYRTGEPAQAQVLEAGHEAAKTQDLHQSLR